MNRSIFRVILFNEICLNGVNTNLNLDHLIAENRIK